MTYKALDLITFNIVAIKEFFPRGYTARAAGSSEVLLSHESNRNAFAHWLTAFAKEAKILASVKGLHGVVKLSDSFKQNNTAYIVTDFLDGISLRAHINAQGGRLNYREALAISRPMLDSLYVIHNHGVIHKDISPENVMIVRNSCVKLIDFGAASAFRNPSEKPYIVLKTGYSPIELYDNRYKLGPWTDIYQAAATLYNAITGELPPEPQARMQNDTLLRPSALGIQMPLIIENTLLKALNIEPQFRFQTMLPLIQTLYNESIPRF